jgi:hypothetical protein
MGPAMGSTCAIVVVVVSLTSGFGSHKSEQIDSKTFEMVNAGDHCERRISRQIAPFALMFGWKIFVVNLRYTAKRSAQAMNIEKLT